MLAGPVGGRLDLWVAIWLGSGPLGGKIGSLDSAMAWILDNLSPMRSFFFEKFVKFRRKCSWGPLDGAMASGPGGVPRDPPYFGVTSVGPKVVLVLGPSLNKIKKVLTVLKQFID